METPDPIEAAGRAGIDLNLIDLNLSLSVEERWRQHDGALAFILKLEEARRRHDARFQSAPREAC